MEDGSYRLSYSKSDNPSTPTEEELIAAYELLLNPSISPKGIMNNANLYLAHIHGVNSKYSVKELTFTRDLVNDWKDLKYWKANYPALKDLLLLKKKNTRPNKIRKHDIYKGDVDEALAYLKAHFLRLVSPFNYFLVPSKNFHFTPIFNGKDKSIGEYEVLTYYVKYKIFNEYIKGTQLESKYDYFENNAMILCNEKIDKNSKAYLNCGKVVINVEYGKNIRKTAMRKCATTEGINP
jgi:hypothetical protein